MNRREILGNIVALTEPGDGNDERLEVLWNEREMNEKIAAQLGLANLTNGNKELSRQKMYEAYQDAFKLPSVTTLSIGMYNRLIKSEDALRIGCIMLTMTMFGFDLIDGEIEQSAIFSNTEQYLNGLNLAIRAQRITSEQSKVRIMIKNGSSLLTKGSKTKIVGQMEKVVNLVVNRYDAVRIDYMLDQELSEVEVLNQTPGTNTLGVDEADVRETIIVRTKILVTQTRSNPVQPGERFRDVDVETQVVDERTNYQDKYVYGTEIIQIGEEEGYDVAVGLNLLDLMVSKRVARRNVIDNARMEMMDEYAVGRDAIMGWQMQVASYGAMYNEQMEDVIMSSDLQKNMSLSLQNSQQLATIASKVTMHEERKFQIDGVLGRQILPFLPFHPMDWQERYWYPTVWDNEEEVVMTRDLLSLNGLSATSGWGVDMQEKIEWDSEPSVITTILKLGETEDAYVFCEVSYAKRVLNTELESTRGTDTVKSGIRTGWDSLNGWYNSNQSVDQNIYVYDGPVLIRGRKVAVTMTLTSVMVCPKLINGTPMPISQTLEWRVFFMREKTSGPCIGGTPTKVIYEGVEYTGVAYQTMHGVERESGIKKPILVIPEGQMENVLTSAGASNPISVSESRRIQTYGGVLTLETIFAQDPITKVTLFVGAEMANNYWSTTETDMPVTIKNERDELVSVNSLFNRPETGRDSAIINSTGIVVVISGECLINVPIPPVNIGVLGYAADYVYYHEALIEAIKMNVEKNRVAIQDVRTYAEWVHNELELFKAAMMDDGGMMGMLKDMFLGFLSDTLFGMVGGAVLNGLSRFMKNANGVKWRMSDMSISQASTRGVIVSNKQDVPMESIGESQLFSQMYLDSRQKKISDFSTAERPVYRNDNKAAEKVQHIDTTERMDITVNVRTAGRYRDGDYPNKVVLGMQNTLSTEGGLPTVSAHYQPLGLLPKGVRNKLHEKITLGGNTRDKLLYDAVNVNTRQPSHAFAVMDDYTTIGPGKYRLTRTLIGIGELNKSGRPIKSKEVGVGGVMITYDSTIKTRDGRLLYTLNDHETSGYSTQEVTNLFKSLFTKKRELNDVLTADEKWEMISEEVSRKMATTDRLAEKYIPDKSKIAAIKRVVQDGDAEWHYNLLTQNCQDAVRDVMAFAARGDIQGNWKLPLKEKLLSERIRIYDSTVGESDVRRMSVYEMRKRQMQLKGRTMRHYHAKV